MKPTGSKSYALVCVRSDGEEKWIERFSLQTKRSEIEKRIPRNKEDFVKIVVYLVDSEDNVLRTQYYLWDINVPPR